MCFLHKICEPHQLDFGLESLDDEHEIESHQNELVADNDHLERTTAQDMKMSQRCNARDVSNGIMSNEGCHRRTLTEYVLKFCAGFDA